MWLVAPDARDLRRPDRAHYVVDVMPDYVRYEDVNLGEGTIPVAQIWADPQFPNCHRDPELRAWLERRRGLAGLVRYGNERGIVIIPPAMNTDHVWLEIKTTWSEPEHSFADILSKTGGTVTAA
jgi:hypothetical protein